MYLTFCKAKIANARISAAELYYEGSITIDENIIQAVGIIPGEKVEIAIGNGITLVVMQMHGRRIVKVKIVVHPEIVDPNLKE